MAIQHREIDYSMFEDEVIENKEIVVETQKSYEDTVSQQALLNNVATVLSLISILIFIISLWMLIYRGVKKLIKKDEYKFLYIKPVVFTGIWIWMFFFIFYMNLYLNYLINSSY